MRGMYRGLERDYRGGFIGERSGFRGGFRGRIKEAHWSDELCQFVDTVPNDENN